MLNLPWALLVFFVHHFIVAIAKLYPRFAYSHLQVAWQCVPTRIFSTMDGKGPPKGQQKIPNSYAYIFQSRWCNSTVPKSAHFSFQNHWMKMLILSVVYRIAVAKVWPKHMFRKYSIHALTVIFIWIKNFVWSSVPMGCSCSNCLATKFSFVGLRMRYCMWVVLCYVIWTWSLVIMKEYKATRVLHQRVSAAVYGWKEFVHYLKT